MRTRIAAGIAAAALATGLAPAGVAHAALVTNDDGSVSLPITPQAQEKNQWCWIASGTVVATYKGADVTQNELCDRARSLPLGTDCPNEPGTLTQLQRAYRSLGIDPGMFISGTLSYPRIQSEVKADRPSLARIGWRSGGGHVLVLHGYKADDQSVLWADPWPSAQRLNVGKYSYLKANSDFTWTHSLAYVGGWR